ncbi:MAG: hypothetical protein ABWZ76_03080 [Acidimicrobiales bacterium]
MTDHDPNHELDELASAHLDGLSTPAEAARIDADPALQARVAAMATARQAVAAGGAPVDPVRRQRAIDAALEAFDAGIHQEGRPPEAGVTSLIDVAAKRTGASSRTLRLLAAAVVAVLAISVPLLARLADGDSDDEQETAALEADVDSTVDRESAAIETTGGEEPAEAGPDLAEDAAASESSGDRSSTPVRAGLLGSFEDLDELAAALRPVPVGTTGEPTSTAPGFEATPASCTDERLALAAGDTVLVLTGQATLGGRAVEVVVYAEPGREPRLRVLDSSDCAVVADRPL